MGSTIPGDVPGLTQFTSSVICFAQLHLPRSFECCFVFLWQVAYVLGQLQNKTASAALSMILRDINEHPMVRHEAAEALGSIAGLLTCTVVFSIISLKTVVAINLTMQLRIDVPSVANMS